MILQPLSTGLLWEHTGQLVSHHILVLIFIRGLEIVSLLIFACSEGQGGDCQDVSRVLSCDLGFEIVYIQGFGSILWRRYWGMDDIIRQWTTLFYVPIRPSRVSSCSPTNQLESDTKAT